MMKISQEEVKHVTKLARLELSGKELEKITGQLDDILSYVDKLSGVNTDNIVPTTHAFHLSNVFREDEIKESLSQAEAVANGPENNGESFQVPRII